MRKGTNFLFLLAVVVAFLAGLEGTAGAQPYQCTAFAAVPPTLRDNGLTETVGDFLLSCTGTLASAGTANFAIFTNTNITSKLLVGTTDEALLMIDEPPPASQVLNTNVFEGTGAGNSVTWTNIPLVPPGPRVFRFTNVRIAASSIPSPGPLPSQAQALISVSGTTSIPINNPVQTVGFIQQGMNFSVVSANFNQSFAPGVSGNPTEFTITFHESFPTAFKKRIEGTDQNMPGFFYHTESGFTSPITGSAGRADTGTRLLARFVSVPAGVHLFVPSTITSSGGSTAVLVSVTSSTGEGGDANFPIPPPGEVVLAAGSGAATWEVTSSNPLAAEDFTIPVTVGYTPNPGIGIPGLGTAMVSGEFAQLSTVATASLTLPIPRFADTATAQTAFTIGGSTSVSVPTMTEWGMIIFAVLAGLSSVLYLSRLRRV